MSGPRYHEGYISLYLNRELYELKLSAFNSMFGFSPSMDLPCRHVRKEFNPNTFWHDLSRDYRYDTSNSKGTTIRNPYIRIAQRLLAYDLFAREDTLNVPRLFDLYFLYSSSKVTDLTLVHPWLISYIVQPLVPHRGLLLEALLPPVLGPYG